MAILCNPDCLNDITQLNWGAACQEQTKTGGIPRFLFLKCDPSMVLPFEGGWENVNNIKWAICNGYMFFTGEVLGQKPKGTFTKKRIGSCTPEITISGSKTITFQDFNAFGDGQEVTFWNQIVANKKHLYFAYVTCDDYLFQPTSSWDLEVDEVHEDTSDGSRFIDGTITFQSLDMIEPIKTAGLNALLNQMDLTTTCYS